MTNKEEFYTEAAKRRAMKDMKDEITRLRKENDDLRFELDECNKALNRWEERTELMELQIKAITDSRCAVIETLKEENEELNRIIKRHLDHSFDWVVSTMVAIDKNKSSHESCDELKNKVEECLRFNQICRNCESYDLKGNRCCCGD